MDDSQLVRIRHSCEHILNYAMRNLYGKKNILRAMGPPTQDGFYFDFATQGEFTISDDMFKAIEKEMRHIIKKDLPFNKKTISYKAARELFADEPYKLEWIDEYEQKGFDLSVYYTGDEYVDLCAGPHVASTKEIGAFALLSIAGAYRRGDEKNTMLTRIYGTAFATKDELKAYKKMKEEAKKRDHRVIGERLRLFTFDNEVGPGLPLWLPNGATIIEEIEKLAKEQEEAHGYKRVRSPHIAKKDLYLRSGHLPYYAEDMFPPMEMDGEVYYLKAMNCPHHHKMFGAHPKSYKDMPQRYAEYGECYRYEDSGSLFGLMRVRSLSMNDAHIYCTPKQFEEEFAKVVDMYLYYFELFGITQYTMRLSKHSKEGLGKKYVDNETLWITTEKQVRDVLVKLKIPFVEADDEAAFYGPKIDVQVYSAIGREFSLSTNQLDFAVPEKFNLTYIDSDGEKKTPLCIHRAPLSTHERFIGFLIEHYGGAFPVWLAPVQTIFIPVNDTCDAYAQSCVSQLQKQHIRAHIDTSADSFSKKIRNAELQKIPYICIVGDQEVNNNSVSIREYRSKKQYTIKYDTFVDSIVTEYQTRANSTPHTS